jgi:cytosine/adenosine deaminase-related metal-dependent hydrolase
MPKHVVVHIASPVIAHRLHRIARPQSVVSGFFNTHTHTTHTTHTTPHTHDALFTARDGDGGGTVARWSEGKARERKERRMDSAVVLGPTTRTASASSRSRASLNLSV